MVLFTPQARIAGLALALVGGGLLVFPAPAQAGVLDTPNTSGSVTFSAASTCPGTGSGDSFSTTTFAADGVPVTTSVTGSQTVAKTGNPADFTTMSGSSTQTITVTQAANALKTIDVRGSAQASLVANLGSAQGCNTSMQAGITNQGTFDLPSAKYVSVDVQSKGLAGTIIILSTPDTYDATFELIQYGVHSRSTHTFYLPAGKYEFSSQHGVLLQAPTATDEQPASRAGSVSYHISFDEPGVATSATKGDGSKYVDLAGGRSCAAGSLTGTWKSKAGTGNNRQIMKATFFVNGVKVGTVKKPKKKTTKTLKGLNPDDPADVLVKMKLAKRGAGTVSAERSYLPCT